MTTKNFTAAFCGALLICASAAEATTIVETGWDLFETQAGSQFDFPTVPNPQVIDFEGNPLGSFDFGGGAVGVGDADTIVLRTEDADLGGGIDTIDIEIVALSLVSAAPVDLGFGAGFEDLFITLNTSSPSIQSTMTIFDTGEGVPHGTWGSILNFSFDVTGGVGGFYATIEKTFTSTDNVWQHTLTAGTAIDGVNRLLNGVDTTGDFWTDGLAIHDAGGIDTHIVATPEPSTALLVAFGLMGLSARGRRASI